MKVKYFIIGLVSLFILSGCGAYNHTGLSAEQSKVYPIVMVANSDVVCGNITFKKGAIFGVSDVSDGKYKGIDTNYGEEQHFPKHSLYIRSLENAYTMSPIVYPDGQFVFESGYLVVPRALNIGTGNDPDEILLWRVESTVCKFDGTTPFSPIEN